MKKAAAILLVFSMMLALCVCSTAEDVYTPLAGTEMGWEEGPVNEEPEEQPIYRFKIINRSGEGITEMTIGDNHSYVTVGPPKSGSWPEGDTGHTSSIRPEGRVWFSYKTESGLSYRTTLPEPLKDAVITILPMSEGGIRLDDPTETVPAVDVREKYPVEETQAEIKVTYPYFVRTESATWYLSKDDIALLGEEAFFRGLYDLLEYQEADFADARAVLSGFISEEVEPIIIYTDFCMKSGMSEIAGAYYNYKKNYIKMFTDWNHAKCSLLHEYVHYLTEYCTDSPVSIGLFSEGIAEYISTIVCKNRMERESYREVLTAEQRDFFTQRGAWNEAENCMDLERLTIGGAESYASGREVGKEYMCVVNTVIDRTEEIQQNPAPETLSYSEAGSMIAFLAETETEGYVFSHWSTENADLEEVFGIPFPELYKHWREWNAKRFEELGLVMK